MMKGNETADASKKGRSGLRIYDCASCAALSTHYLLVKQITEKDEKLAKKSERIKKLKRIIRKQREKIAEGHTVHQGDGSKIDDEDW